MKTSLSPKKIIEVIADPVLSAKAIKLKYVNTADEGIERRKQGKGYHYFIKKSKINDGEILKRINALVIPPAWQNVWICKTEDGHLQCTGVDVKERKQYIYHEKWISFRNEAKYYRLAGFGKALPAMRLQIEKDLAEKNLSKRKVLAAVVSLMERTHIRVGNSMYEKLYGSYGLTTLKDKHVEIKGSKLKFHFIGKKGVEHDISIKSPRLGKIVKQCRDIPGKELFQFYDDENNRHSIDSGMVNEYIAEISGEHFTAKDFRTWAGSVEALMALKEIGEHQNEKEAKHNIVCALDTVSSLLGNTRSVCKKYYVHPDILSLYEEKTLNKYLKNLDEEEKSDGKADLTAEEKVLMKIIAG